MKLLIRVLALILLLPLLSGCWDTGDGQKVGVITKVARQGVFCKTWEVEIQRGGLANGSGVTGAVFHFTVENDTSSIKQLQEALDNQSEVKIFYRTEGMTWCRSEAHPNAFLVKLEKPGVNIDRPLKTEVLTTQTVQERDDSQDEKINKLLQLQSQLIEELAKRK